MPGNVIELGGLRKEVRGRKGRIVAVDHLDLEVPEGGVYGFLGPNGSGKTTTIRCLLGLARPTAGDVRLLGRRVPRELPGAIADVGALVEAPGVLPGMTAEQTLSVLAASAGIGSRRVDEVLDQVGLTARAGDAARGYSLGMRQRLGVAVALLKDPAVLILDEPANGLDPAGIRDMRDLVRRLGDEGRTVCVSCHQLGEVQQVCDRVAIVAHGRTIVAGTVDEVLAATGAASVLVRLADPGAGCEVLERAGYEVEVVDGHLRVAADPDDAAYVARALGQEGLWPSELRPDEVSLEDVFLELTGELSGQTIGGAA
jgi:ABC-2 type transport system ATP-binding protein